MPIQEEEPKKNGPRESTTTDQNGDKLYECSKGCGRRFLLKALDIHESICVKVFQNKRNEFNSKKTRVVDNNQEKLIKINDVNKSNFNFDFKISFKNWL